jgi:hypothetical protein
LASDAAIPTSSEQPDTDTLRLALAGGGVELEV